MCISMLLGRLKDRNIIQLITEGYSTGVDVLSLSPTAWPLP